MSIERDRRNLRLKLHQKGYLEKLITKFSMEDSKPMKVHLARHFQRSLKKFPKNEEERRLMEKIPYSRAVGLIMYSMISTRPDVSFSISVLIKFMGNTRKEH